MAPRSKKHSIRTPLLLLATAEVLCAYLSVLGTAILLYGSVRSADMELGSLHLKAVIVSAMILASLISMGLYHFHRRIHFREILVRVSVGIALGSLGLAAIYFLFPDVSLPRKFVVIAVLMSLVIVLLVRSYFFHHVDTNVFRRRTLVYGAGERARSIGDLRRRADRRGFKIVGSIPVRGDAEVSRENGLLIRDKSLLWLAAELEIDEIVIAMDDRRGNLPVRELFECMHTGVDIVDLLDFLERESEKIRIDLIKPSWLIFSPSFRTSQFRKIAKRLTDFLFSFSALLVLWPLLLLVALAIKAEDGFRAPVFYRQCRVGHKGLKFSMLKFRSMIEDAENGSGAMWARENDPRITRVGRHIRKYRLDELPQLINVLLGEMSLVGPRPERPEFVEKLAKAIPYYLERHTSKPGITGWAQLRYSYGCSEEDAIEKLQYDLYYVKNQSFVLDIIIMLQTLEVVLWGKGAR